MICHVVKRRELDWSSLLFIGYMSVALYWLFSPFVCNELIGGGSSHIHSPMQYRRVYSIT